MTIKIKTLHPKAVVPQYAHGPLEDAGVDLRAIESYILAPMKPTLVKTGLSIELPPGYEAQIRPRSGLALKHGLMVVNSPGTIDPSYRGEIGVILMWTGASHNDSARFVINEGDRIAQLITARYEYVEFELVEELSSTERGEGGFGSSGVASDAWRPDRKVRRLHTGAHPITDTTCDDFKCWCSALGLRPTS